MDMDVQIKFTGDSNDAQKSIEGLADSLESVKSNAEDSTSALDSNSEALSTAAGAADDLSKETGEVNEKTDDLADISKRLATVLQELSDALKGVKKEGKAAGDELEGIGKKAGGFKAAKDGSISLRQELDSFEKSAKKFGREFSTFVTAPIVALAGLSIKKVFDDGALQASSGVMRQLALSVQGLKRNFDELLLSIGTQLAPTFIKIIGVVNNVINVFKNMDKETRSTLFVFAGIAAALGPLVLAMSSFISIGLKVATVFSAIWTAVGPIVTPFVKFLLTTKGAILALIPAFLGLANIFRLLMNSGVSAFDALRMTFNLFVTGFNNYITKYFVKGVSLMLSGLAAIAGTFSSTMQKGLKEAEAGLDGFVKTIEGSFEGSKNAVNQNLATIGRSAGDAFTYGLSESFEGMGDRISNLFAKGTQNVARDGMLDSEREAWEKARQRSEDEVAQQFIQMQQRIAASSMQISQSISGGMTDALLDFADGTKDAGQAFADFARQTVRSLAAIATQAAIMNALFPPGTPMGNMIGALAASTQLRGFATGGLVTGPGTGTSDSIVARLSNGEFVNDAKTVRHFGSRFFENLKSMAHGGVPVSPTRGPAFADGGMISSASQAPSVVIQNSGSPKQVKSMDYDASSAITTIVLDDINKNGPISKSIQGTFGMKRGGIS